MSNGLDLRPIYIWLDSYKIDKETPKTFYNMFLCADLFLNQKFDFIRNWNKNYGILVGGKDI